MRLRISRCIDNLSGMGLLDIFKSKARLAEPSAEAQRLAVLFALANAGCSTDEIPQGIGKFGYEITNPIPVHLPPGRNEYLKSLRLLSGEAVQCSRVGSKGMPNVDGQQGTADIVEVRDLGGRLIATLYFSVYHQRNSRKAPEGFTLAV